MKIIKLIVLLQIFTLPLFAQMDKEKALNIAREAIKIMDEGKIEESIILLEESEKLDPENYMYPYEIAYALIQKKEYKNAIKILEKIKSYKSINSQVYQMSGNCYSFLGKSKKAIKEYEAGMKIFPDKGNLHLEKGNIFLDKKEYDEAILNYENGIKVDPSYPSNYYRLAKLFLNSSDKLSGLVYGELFMNLERTTARTQEMSELLYNTYKTSISFGENNSSVKFCQVVIFMDEAENIKLPLCAVFEKHLILATLDKKEINLSSLASIRKQFIKNFYFGEDYKNYPNVLFEYQKKMLDDNVFDAYNHYLFQISNPGEFSSWQESNEKDYEDFVEWYLEPKNDIKINNKNMFLRQ